MESQGKYKSLVEILKNSGKITWGKDELSPIVELTVTQENFDDLSLLMDTACITDCIYNNKSLGADPSILNEIENSSAQFILSLPIPNKEIAVVKDLDSLLKYPNFLTETPKRVFFISKLIFEIPTKYGNAITFANVLKLISDHYEKNDNRVVCYFYDGIKIRVPITYMESDLTKLHDIQSLQESLTTPRLKERLRMLRSALIKTAITAPSEDKVFSHLLASFKKIKTIYEQDWNLYISDFSIDELLDEFEENVLKIADKLNAALSDLQKTIITIPLAIIFAAPRIDTVVLQSMKNGIIVASVWIFAMFTWVFFSNHKRTLNFISDEIVEYKSFLLDRHKGLSEKVAPKFEGLNKRCDSQKNYRKIVGSLMWVAVISISIIFFYPQISPLLEKLLVFLQNGNNN